MKERGSSTSNGDGPHILQRKLLEGFSPWAGDHSHGGKGRGNDEVEEVAHTGLCGSHLEGVGSHLVGREHPGEASDIDLCCHSSHHDGGLGTGGDTPHVGDYSHEGDRDDSSRREDHHDLHNHHHHHDEEVIEIDNDHEGPHLVATFRSAWC